MWDGRFDPEGGIIMRINIKSINKLLSYVHGLEEAMIQDLANKGHGEASAKNQVENVLRSLRDVILDKEQTLFELRGKLEMYRGSIDVSQEAWKKLKDTFPKIDLTEEQKELARNGTGYLDGMYKVAKELGLRAFVANVDDMDVVIIDELMLHQHHTHKELLVGYDIRLAKGGDVNWANYVLKEMSAYC